VSVGDHNMRAAAHTRLKRLPSGRIRYQLKRPWYDGSTHLELRRPHGRRPPGRACGASRSASGSAADPLALMRWLALLIPPPFQHTLRYHGLLAPHAPHRAKLDGAHQVAERVQRIIAERRARRPALAASGR